MYHRRGDGTLPESCCSARILGMRSDPSKCAAINCSKYRSVGVRKITVQLHLMASGEPWHAKRVASRQPCMRTASTPDTLHWPHFHTVSISQGFSAPENRSDILKAISVTSELDKISLNVWGTFYGAQQDNAIQ